MTYEQVTFESLPNRAGHVERFMGVAETPDQAYIVLAFRNGSWNNGRETQDEATAIEVAERWTRNGSIVKIVQAFKTMPVAEVEHPATSPVISESKEEVQKEMVPTQEQLQAAIKESSYSHGSETYVSVQNVYRHLPHFEAPRRYNNVVEEAIKSVYPAAKYEGGGVFQI